MTISALSHDVWRKPTYVILIIGNLTITVRLPLNLYQNVSLYHSYWFKLYINNFESLWERHCISIVPKYNVWLNIEACALSWSKYLEAHTYFVFASLQTMHNSSGSSLFMLQILPSCALKIAKSALHTLQRVQLSTFASLVNLGVHLLHHDNSLLWSGFYKVVQRSLNTVGESH